MVKKAGDLPSVGALRAERTMWLGTDAASTKIRAATVDGFGRATRPRTAKILRLSEDLPVGGEIVDAEAQIRSFLEASRR